MSAVYAHDVLSMTVPFEATRSGEAELRLEVLNPEDRVLGRSIEKARCIERPPSGKRRLRTASVHNGSSQECFQLADFFGEDFWEFY